MIKVDIVVKLIKDLNLDGILINSDDNRFWFSKFLSSAGYFFINKKHEVFFLIDGRYYDFACSFFKETKVQVVLLKTSINKTLKDLILDLLDKLEIRKLGIESEYTSLKDYMFLNSIKDLKLISFDSYKLRSIKDENEINNLQIAANIAAETIEWIRKQIKPGMTEKEVAKMITIHMLELGGSKNSFDPIVASGINGSNPHHKPTNKVIENGDMITIDIGCVYNGYCSDITRSFILGNKPNNDKMVEIYNKVLEAQLKGIESAIIGNTGSEVDKVCRDIISSSEYKDFFNHSTGHGVGIQVHELPNVSASNNEKLVNNNVITIEPGIYVPKIGGVRIEDTIVIRENKPIILTIKASKNLFN